MVKIKMFYVLFYIYRLDVLRAWAQVLLFRLAVVGWSARSINGNTSLEVHE